MAEPKGGLSFIRGDDAAAVAANKAYQDALERLNKSLEARQNRMFDPTMLALAEGFLTPGRTGSFGEALGTAAGKMRAAEEAEGKQEQELAQAKLGLAQQQMQLARQKQMADVSRAHFFGQGQQATPAGGAVAAGAPSGAAPSGAARSTPDPAAAYIALAYARGEDPDKIEIEAIKIRRDADKVVEGGVYNTITKRFEPFGIKEVPVTVAGQSYNVPVFVAQQYNDLIKEDKFPEAVNFIKNYIKQTGAPSAAALAGAQTRETEGAKQEVSTDLTPRSLPGPDGVKTYNVPVSDARKLDELIRVHGIDSEVVRRAAAPFTGASISPAPAGAPSATPSAAPSGAPVRLGVPSVQQQALDAKAAELTTQKRIEFNEQQRNKILEASDDASEAMRRASIFRQYADAPDANAIFGILSNDKLMSAAARLVEQGIGVTTPGGRIAVGIPEVQTIIRNLGLSPEQQAKAQVAFQLMVEAQIKMSQYAKGAVSNYEQGLFAQSGINKEDIPGSIRIKSDMITLRGQFDKDVARKFEDSNQDVRTFKKSDWYQNRLKQYDEDLMKVASGNRLRVPGASAPQGSGTQPRLRYNRSTGQWSE